jgi:hypothetical protein
LRCETPWSAKGNALGEEFRLPSLIELDDGRPLTEVRLGWHESGLGLAIRVSGKRQAPWCRDNRLEDSDGFHLWLDTRDTHNIHRASRFCHHLVFLPSGGGHRLDAPVGEQLLLNRAREHACPIRPGVMKVRSEKRVDGYLLEAFIPGDALTGYEPTDHKKLGFFYSLTDREIGNQQLVDGSEIPFDEDPSVWATLELTK